MKNIFLTIIILFLFIGKTFCQTEKTRNWSVEIGGVYNQWHQFRDIQTNSLDTTVLHHLMKFHLVPSLRFNRQFRINDEMYLKPFIGISVNSAKVSYQYIDHILPITYFLLSPNVPNSTRHNYIYIPQIETGTFTSFILANWNVQFGLKAQYDLSTYYNTRTTFFKTKKLNKPEFRKIEYRNPPNRFGMDIGMRGEYNFHRFFIALESWYEVIDITTPTYTFNPTFTIKSSIQTTNLRLMFGYKF